MQGTGYILVGNKKILVLLREVGNPKRGFYRSLKLRKTGKDGIFLEDESIFLNERLDLVQELLDGKVIKC